MDSSVSPSGNFIGAKEKVQAHIEAEKFLATILPPPSPGATYALGYKTQVGFAHEHLDTVAKLLARMVHHDQKGIDVYFASVTISVNRKSQRAVSDALALKAFRLDLDVGPDKPHATKQSALDALSQFEQAFCAATYVIDSGGGAHTWWAFDVAISKTEWQELAHRFAKLAEQEGLYADKTVTTDIVHVLRSPGTRNHKIKGHPRPVTILRQGDVLSIASVRERLAAVELNKPTAKQNADFKDGTSPPAASSWFDPLSTANKLRVVSQLLGALPIPVQDNRESWFKVGAALKGAAGLTDDERYLSWRMFATQQPIWQERWNDEEERERWQGIDGTGIGVLIKLAYSHGWRRTPETYAGRFATNEEAGKYICENYIYVRTDNAYLDANGNRLSVDAFNRSCARLMPKTGDKQPVRADYVASDLGYVEQADRIGYAPGEGRIYLDNGIRHANTYRAWEPEPLVPTDAEKLLVARLWTHLENGDSDASRQLAYINRAIAYLAQNPRARIPKGLLIIGETEGSGKTTQMLEIPRRLFGWRNVSAVGANETNSDFNAYMSHRIVAFEEIWQVRQVDALKKANDLKPLITDSRVRIVAKGRDGNEVRNVTTIFATSNHIDAINVANTDRRWVIMNTSAEPIPRDLADELYGFLNGERAPGVLRHVYLHMNIEGFNPNVAPQISEAKLRAREVSRSDWEQVIHDAHSEQRGCFARDIVSALGVKKFVDEVLSKSISLNHITKVLQSAPLGGKEIHTSKLIDSKTMSARGWVIRNHEQWLKEKSKTECYDELTAQRGLLG